jgi:hypothetical protein
LAVAVRVEAVLAVLAALRVAAADFAAAAAPRVVAARTTPLAVMIGLGSDLGSAT